MLRERVADPGPGGGDGLCPAPGGIDTQPQLAGAAGDAGGHVQDPGDRAAVDAFHFVLADDLNTVSALGPEVIRC